MHKRCSLFCQRALTQKQTLEAVTHLSEVKELPLSPSHSFVMPSAVKVPRPNWSRPQSWLPAKLPSWEQEGVNQCPLTLVHSQSARRTINFAQISELDFLSRPWEF